MICERCGEEKELAQCAQCGSEIIKLGPYCYICGSELETEPEVSAEAEMDDFDKRVLCSDGACIGVINEQGVCKICGKPYTPET